MSDDSDETDMGKVSKRLQRFRGQVKACYEGVLKKDGTLGGRLAIHLDVVDGKVESVYLADSLGVPEFDACIRNRAQSWTFDRSVNGEVQWPIVLRKK